MSEARPASAGALFAAFNRLALQGFGGVLPVAQRELVERLQWMTREQFVETLAIAQVLPGPNIVNVAIMIGDRFSGARGVLAALGGLMGAPLVIELLLAVLYGQLASVPLVAGALRGMGAVAAGLVLSTALKLAPALRTNALGWPLAALGAMLTFVFVGLLRWPLVGVVAGLGGLAGVLATLAGSLQPSTTLALAATRWGAQHATSRAVQAFKTGLAPLPIGLLVATGWVLTEPARHDLAILALVPATMALMLGTRASPLWAIALGAVVGAWVGR